VSLRQKWTTKKLDSLFSERRENPDGSSRKWEEEGEGKEEDTLDLLNTRTRDTPERKSGKDSYFLKKVKAKTVLKLETLVRGREEPKRWE